eukprot:2626090-Prymnesium_polylepis.1
MGEGLGHAPSEAPRLRRGLHSAQPAGRRRQRGGDAMRKAVSQATRPQEGVWADPRTVRLLTTRHRSPMYGTWSSPR